MSVLMVSRKRSKEKDLCRIASDLTSDLCWVIGWFNCQRRRWKINPTPDPFMYIHNHEFISPLKTLFWRSSSRCENSWLLGAGSWRQETLYETWRISVVCFACWVTVEWWSDESRLNRFMEEWELLRPILGWKCEGKLELMDVEIWEKQGNGKLETKRISANHTTSQATTTVGDVCVALLEDQCVKSQQENRSRWAVSCRL